jgi:hypothetical protein
VAVIAILAATVTESLSDDSVLVKPRQEITHANASFPLLLKHKDRSVWKDSLIIATTAVETALCANKSNFAGRVAVRSKA